MERQSLRGKWAIITGASREIGRAIAPALAREGAGVVICARGLSEGVKTAHLASLKERSINPSPSFFLRFPA